MGVQQPVEPEFNSLPVLRKSLKNMEELVVETTPKKKNAIAMNVRVRGFLLQF